MFANALTPRSLLHMAFAMPILVVGWIFMLSGVFHLVTLTFLNEAVWEFAFSFAAMSLAVLIASRVKFLSKPIIRKTFLYSLIGACVLFLGYITTGELFMYISKIGAS